MHRDSDSPRAAAAFPPGGEEVIRLPLGLCVGSRVLVPFVNAYLVPAGGGWVLVDAGPPGCERAILATLDRHGMARESVRWIVVTHGHFDHAGSVPALKRLLPHAGVLMHAADRPLVEGAWPRALRAGCWRSVPQALAARALGPLLKSRLRAWSPELLAGVTWLEQPESETPVDLRPFGIEAEALRTPGHSAGSLSLLLPGGGVVTGDVVQAAVLVEDAEALRHSHLRLAALRPRRLYRGHGRPAGGEVLDRMVKAGRLDAPGLE
jgi:glyoxylase-like metal-dependent hydrolase (beta-lactamase superfamily II)